MKVIEATELRAGMKFRGGTIESVSLRGSKIIVIFVGGGSEALDKNANVIIDD